MMLQAMQSVYIVYQWLEEIVSLFVYVCEPALV